EVSRSPFRYKDEIEAPFLLGYSQVEFRGDFSIESGTGEEDLMKVVIADDHRLMLKGVRRALEAAQDIEVVGEARTGAEVLPLVHQTAPDVVLLDLRMPELDGFGCLDR